MLRLAVVGAVLEFVGIVLIGWPDLLPGAKRFSAWLASAAARVRYGLRRLFRRPRHRTIHAASGAYVVAGGSARGVVSPRPGSTDAELIRYLLDRVALMEEALDGLRSTIAANREGHERAAVALHAELTADFEAGLRAAFAQHRPLRIAGMVALFGGLVCVTVASAA